MLIHEFEELTGFHPSADLYSVIEEHYNDFIGDKRSFCIAYKNNENGIASRIQREADSQAFSHKRDTDDRLFRLADKVTELEIKLRAAEGWSHYEDKDAFSQSEYDLLKDAHGTRALTDDEAKDLLYKWYGFAKEKVAILRSAPVLEKSRDGRIREVGKASRDPLYNASDWNYVRFIVAGFTLELKSDSISKV